ncbi:hypothetical protein HUJ04_001459 [Dendroctonus ponderosae]|uniref:BRCT domain-containing protein n=1 Tax=Dendroctonus ponderosae TaxID=77166 RepID=A0AAR5QD16_DENPD|nr:hypothetical protein HUJ04_001459 [Dendroctonus ponderosae]
MDVTTYSSVDISNMADVRMTFLLQDDITDESKASSVMTQAYDLCKPLVKDILWVKEANLNELELTNLDYLVVENLDGKDFSKFTDKKCCVVGPMAISVCSVEGKPIPKFKWPILNVAMYGCKVTSTHLSKNDKEKIKNKVQLMGGLYNGNFTDLVTHLICDGTKSEKYMLAAEKGMKLMLPNWIDELFEENKSNYVSANDPKLLEKFKCPALHKLTICSTGISSSKERLKLSTVIAGNGGRMEMKLKLSETDILVCCGSAGTTSEKYKAARNTSHISCVTEEWVYDSIKKGYALPREHYHVKVLTSTPTKEGENIDPNFSTVSSIGECIRKSQINNTVNDTYLPKDTLQNTRNDSTITGSSKRKADENLVDKMDIKKIKNGGNFLDGCSVYVVGFSSSHREKLNKIINISGATRYDSFSTRVSHVLVGDPTCSEVTTIKAMGGPCYFVNVKWLYDSIMQQRQAEEEKYLVRSNEASNGADVSRAPEMGSPLSQKVLSFLRNDMSSNASERTMANPVDENEDVLTQKYLESKVNKDEDDDTLAKLLKGQDNLTSLEAPGNEKFTIHSKLSKKSSSPVEQNNISNKSNNTLMQASQVASEMCDLEVSPIFESCKFFLGDFEGENAEYFQQHITNARGTVVEKSFKGVCDYVILPMIYANLIKLPSAQEVINDLWLLECINNNSLCSKIEYFHRPIQVPATQPLKDCVVTLSGYVDMERDFLGTLIEALGGIFQELLCRKARPEKNIMMSTHLVSAEASGKKYEGALKWNLPVVTKDWLLECLKTGINVPLQEFLIGKSKSVVKPETDEGQCSKFCAPGNTESTPVKIPNKLVTPINKILKDPFNDRVMSTPSTAWSPKTPETPIGQFIRPNPSPGLRKEMQRYVNSFPDFVPPKRRNSTPLSELKRRLIDKVLGREEYALQDDARLMTDKEETQEPESEHPVDQQPNVECNETAVHQKLQELHLRVMASGSSSATKRSSRTFESVVNVPGIVKTNTEIQSQVCTVGWDFGEEKAQNSVKKVFLLSGIEATKRSHLANDLKKLGGLISEMGAYDPSCTHLVCGKPGRNEKTLACMAAGKWIIHTSYVDNCIAAGHFLDEEEYEFGNPKARVNIQFEDKASCIPFWRKEIKRRGYGAFSDLRAIVVAGNREPIVNVIEAGGGVVVSVNPPFDDPIHATHCLIELKTVKDLSAFVVLAEQGIKCINTIYINDFLWRSNKEDVDYVIPYFSKYYR